MWYIYIKMNFKNIMSCRKENKELSQEQIEFLVNGFISGKISKAEMSEFLLSVVQKDLTENETFALTCVMLESGQTYDLSCFEHTVDKHSTGGVSDNTTLIVVPLFALFGFTSIKMSGGALGHTGGTADKILCFEGLQNQIEFEKAVKIAKETNACFITSSKDVAPADKKIYALRDEIGAMSIGLIASSIMSKKFATGNKNLILDVKFGNGALINDKTQAEKLALLMQKIGLRYGVNTQFVLGDMNQPLGTCVGDFLEVAEVLENLKTGQETPLVKHSLNLVATALSKALNLPEAEIYAQGLQFIREGKVLEKLKQIVEAQGGKFSEKSFGFALKNVVKSNKSGIITCVNTKEIGFLNKRLSKEIKGYKGFKILKRIGDNVHQNEPIFELYFETDNFELLQEEFNNLIKVK